jgi:hypothetical protein
MQKQTYSQKFRQEWLQMPVFKDWLKPNASDKTKAVCRFCNQDVYARIADLKRRMETKTTKNLSHPFKVIHKRK